MLESCNLYSILSGWSLRSSQTQRSKLQVVVHTRTQKYICTYICAYLSNEVQCQIFSFRFQRNKQSSQSPKKLCLCRCRCRSRHICSSALSFSQLRIVINYFENTHTYKFKGITFFSNCRFCFSVVVLLVLFVEVFISCCLCFASCCLLLGFFLVPARVDRQSKDCLSY